MAPTPGLRPFLKWAGGKRRLAPALAAHFGLERSPRRLVEPFCGSAAVSLALHERAASFWLNDASPDVVNLLRRLQDEPRALIGEVRALFVPENHDEERYYALREEFNGAPELVRRAALFVYLNRHGFNGLCRYNASGRFNVPFGRYAGPPGAPVEELKEAAAFLLRARVTGGDFGPVLDACGEGDTVYCDPPYVPLSKTASFTQYAAGDFGPAEQQRLVESARRAAERGAIVVISNHDTPQTRALYAGARLDSLQVRRSISQKTETRGDVAEIVAVFGG